MIVPKNMFIYYILQSPQSGFLRIFYTVKNLLLFQGARRKSKIYRITKYTEFKKINGARDRNRTGTLVLGATDFKSVVSTNFTTRAWHNALQLLQLFLSAPSRPLARQPTPLHSAWVTRKSLSLLSFRPDCASTKDLTTPILSPMRLPVSPPRLSRKA